MPLESARPERRARSLPLRRKLVFMALACLLPLVALFALEGALRLYLHLAYGVEGKSYGIHRRDPVLGVRLAASSYNTMREFNDRAFQHHEDVLEPRPPGALRVVTYGGSTVFCPNLRMGECWPLRLERLLRTHVHPQSQVLNAGDIGVSLGHQLIRAREELPELGPDVVILYAGINEEANSALLKTEGIDLARELEAGRHGLVSKSLAHGNWWLLNSAVYKLFHHTIRPRIVSRAVLPLEAKSPAPIPAGIGEPHAASLENYLRVLNDFMDLASRHDVEVLFVVQATASSRPFYRRFTEVSRRGAPLARSRGAATLDAQTLVDTYPGEATELFATAVHLSPRGAELLAAFLFEEYFRERGVSRRRGPSPSP